MMKIQPNLQNDQNNIENSKLSKIPLKHLILKGLKYSP